ncbi:MAG: hypothetical protein ACR2H1_10060 [Limisphaerales bacterium]
MNADVIKKMFGSSFPTAVELNGVLMPLTSETPFSRYYHSGDRKTGGCNVSRFMDGSASMTLAVLEREWPTWTPDLRADFVRSCRWLYQQADFAGMLRVIMRHGKPDDWRGIAVLVATYLFGNEAFPFLIEALQATEIGHCSNIIQAIAATKHPEAEITLRQHLQTVWEHPALWNDDEFNNWVAFDATTCISHLIELGASPAEFEDRVRKLAQHVCAGNRDSCPTFLSKYYPWLLT